MRHLFHSKDHKQNQSLRLQKELQKEEETLWKIEQEKRKLQEELDMKMARKLQEEMEHREQDPQRQEQQQQPELTDEEVARRLQEELNRGQSPTHDASPSPSPAPAPAAPPPPVDTRSNQELSDEQYARMLQEQFEAEERQAQEQRGSSSSPALPPRTLSSDNTTPSSSIAPPPLPSKPVAYNHSTHSLGHGSTSRPPWINHASSSSTSSSINLPDQPVTQQPPPQPQSYPSTSSSSYPPQPQPSQPQPPQPASPVAHTVYSNASIPPPYQPPATSSTGYPPYPSSPSQQQQQQQQPQWAAYPSPTPHPQQSYHTQPPSSPAQQHPQQPYPTQPPPSSPAQQHPQQSYHSQPPSSPAQQQQHHPITQQQEPSTATMGSTLFSPKNDPVMFIVPPAQQPTQQQDASQHPAFMPMPAPEDHQRTMYPPQQPSNPVNQPQQQPQQPYPQQQQPQQPYPQQQQPQQQQPLDEEYRSVKPAQSSSSRRVRDPTPPPSRSTTRASAGSANKSDTNPFADSFAAEVSEGESSSEEEEEEEEERSTHKDEDAPTITKKVGKDNQQQQQQQQHAFDPSRYFDEEDLVDLNAPAHHDDDDDDGSSDDGSYVGPVSSKPAVEMAVQTEPVSAEKDLESKANENEVDAVKDAGVDSKGIQATQTTSSNEKAKDKPVVPEESLLDIDLEPTPVQRHEPRARAISNVDTKAEIQRRLAEQMKKSSATRVDPTFGISMGPPPAAARRRDDSDKTQEEEEEERAKDDKVQETLEHQESMHSLTPGPSMFYHHHRSQSASVLVPPGTGHIPQATPYMNHAAYDDMAYTPTPVVYPANVLRAGAPPTMSPEPNEAGLATMDNTYEVPSNEYGYYHVDSNGYPTKDDSDAKSVKSNMTANPKDKALPKIPKSDPNHRHITVPSVNPGQRVWIRLNPTDTGKALAQRIHVVATYKSRKILSIKTTSGRVIPLDDTPVFDDWTEIANLEDGAPWEVEWGQLDDPFSGGRALIKSIKASLLAGKD